MSTTGSSRRATSRRNKATKVKCVVVGDGTVGKTCMLETYVKGEFPKKYIPTIFKPHLAQLTVDQKPYELDLYDTAGQEHYAETRQMTYPDTDVFLVCFSVVSQTSYDAVKNHWVPDIRDRVGRNAEIIIVGTKVDLRQDNDAVQRLQAKGERILTKEDGDKLAKSMARRKKTIQYRECSAKTRLCLDELFDSVVRSTHKKAAASGRFSSWFKK